MLTISDIRTAVKTPATLFRNKLKGGVYVVKDFVVCQNPDTKEWFHAVLYRKTSNEDYYCKSVDSFINEFELIKY